MKNRTTLEQVREFHEVFGHPVAEKVGDETLETRQLRIKLLFEELSELAEATDCKGTFGRLALEFEKWNDEIDGNNVDHVAELDALLDQQVVLDGKFLTSGHWRVKDVGFAEVHRSNMSKASHFTFGDKSAQEWAEKLAKDKGTSVHHINKNGNFVYVREDGKILKGPDFSEPDLKQFVK